MNNQDRQAIEGLFSRLADAERQTGQRDAEAEAFIRQRIADQPGAPYYMAQTIVMQNVALEQAQQRIEELERDRTQAAPASGGMFGGLFGGAQAQERPRHTGSVPVAGHRTPTPQAQPQQGGGGFLAGAAQTAMGVAGGVLLGNAIGGMFSGGNTAEAAPAEAAASQPEQTTPAETAAEPASEPAEDESGGGFFDSIFGGDDFEL